MGFNTPDSETAYYAAVEESKKLAKFIIRIEANLGNHPHTSILAAAATGDPDKLDELSGILGVAIRELDDDQLDSIVYDGRDPESRALADWWDKHKADHPIVEEEDVYDKFSSRPEFLGVDDDPNYVIVERVWYERACKIVAAIDFVDSVRN